MQEQKKKDNLILQLSFELAISVVDFCAQLDSQRKWTFSNQILSAGLALGANIRAAHSAEGKADFIHKLKVAAKEAEQLEFYMEVCHASEHLPANDRLLDQLQTISSILNTIITTAKSNLTKKSADQPAS